MSLDHERLVVYQRSRELCREVHRILKEIHRGNGEMVDQLRRCSSSIPLNTAEAAGEYAAREKARFFRIARRSATEAAAALDNVVDTELVEEGRIIEAKRLTGEVVAMRIVLAKRFEGEDR